MSSWWRRQFQPSLARRLLLAQVVLMLSLWGLFMAFLVWVVLHEGATEELNRRFDLVLTVADNLADRPDRMQQTLRQVDEFLRGDDAVEDKPDGRVSMIVWDGERTVFASPGIDGNLHNTQLNVMQSLPIGGSRWRGITRQSTKSGIRVMLLAPGAASDIWMTLTLNGFLVMPLIISLPLLVLPAWLSVKLALRPWRALSEELASRGSRDLHPLAFRAKHRELRPLVGNLNALLERLRASASRERNFIADAAHELRTPLAAMRVNVEALRGYAATCSQSELLEGILRSNARATRLVGQLLALTRNEAVTVTDTTTVLSLEEVVRDRLAFLAELARANRVELELRAESDVRVMAGIESLVSLIDNLVENAIKYSPAAAVVAVSVERAEGHAVLTVADEGPGIPPAQLARVFDRFFRGADHAQSGSGLGLAIVKSAVERNGGTISLGPTSVTHGLTATVHLPLWRPGGSASAGGELGARLAEPPSPPRCPDDLRIARKLS